MANQITIEKQVQAEEANESKHPRKLTLMEAYVMAVGGMIGGGIFSVLGLVLEISGPWASLSFLIAGVLTFITGLSYAGLYEQQKVPGGSVAFIKHATGSDKLAGHCGWALLLGYIFTNGLYAYTFGHYFAHVLAAPEWVAPVAAISITCFIIAVNLVGVGESGMTEIITVWGKLLVLGALGLAGLMHFDMVKLTSIGEHSPWTALLGAAIIYVAFEGFQLLTYDTEDMENPQQNLRKAMMPSIITSTVIYVVVALGALMLTSVSTLLSQKEVALAIAGKQAFGNPGLWIVTVGALFSAASAINATLFASARLLVLLAKMNQVPRWLTHQSEDGIPRRAVTIIGIAGGIFAVVSSIEQIVSFASFTFLAVFSIVNVLYALEAKTKRAKITACVAAFFLSAALLTAASWLALYRMNELMTAIGIAAIITVGRIWYLKACPEADDAGFKLRANAQ